MSTLPETQAWRALAAHAPEAATFNIAALNDSEKQRAARLIHTLDGATYDFSRHRVTSKTLDLLLDLARQQDVAGNFARMMAGEKINATEQHAAWHTALRAKDAPSEVHETLARMKTITDKIRADSSITDIVHIGIGGSDLGPRLVCCALADKADGPRIHFVANVDPADLDSALKNLSPAKTLVIAVSKTFTTQETMINLARARAWLKNDSRIIAVTANVDAARALGIAAEFILPFWNWVGGRFSVWSAAGLSIAIANGFDAFQAFLDGAARVDRHVRETPLEKNIPVLLALLELWCRNFMGCAARAVLPYSQRLALLPAYLQQLEMESNGKRVDRQGRPCAYATAPVVFGSVGTNAQHAFMQMLHQGTDIIPCDFIGLADSAAQGEAGRVLMANMQAQARALMLGNLDAPPHAVYPGNRPSTCVVLPQMDAASLGSFLAMAEHKTAVLGFLWNINSFDQFGVELGKAMAKDLLAR